MLSNGLGLHLGGVKMRQLVFDYTFDFTASGPTIIDDIYNRGNLTIQLGQNAPGESTNDWLAGTYTTHWTANGYSGLEFRVNHPDVGFSGGKKGDLGVMSYKLFLDGDWDGTDPVNLWGNKMYNYLQGSTSVNFPQDSIITVEVPKNRTVNNNTYAAYDSWNNISSTNKIQMYTGQSESAGDAPNIGAVIYIKDFNFQVWR